MYRRFGLSAGLWISLWLAAGGAFGASVIQLESGAVDVYEPPRLPECPDGRETELAARAVDWGEPPRVSPVSIHQLEAEYYRSFRAETEQQWDALKAARRAAAVAETPPSRTVYGASRPGPFRLQKQVFGFHPYWEGSGYTNYTFDLLSTVAYFSYDVNPTTGYAVTMNSWSNTPLVEWAHSSGTKVVLSATLFSGHSTFFGSAAAQSNLISELIRVVQLRNADGVNIDFEGMSSTNYRVPFTSFMTNLAARVHAAVTGSYVSVCLPAVDWYNVFDVATLGSHLDQFVMMGYDYYWRTGPNAGPVAPLKASTVFGAQCVQRSVSNYLAAGLSPSKLLVGVPYYGYEWPTASTNYGAATTGSGTARTYAVAISRAETYGKGWDTNSLTPYYMYGSYAQGWFEDTNSLGAKYDFFMDKGLAGVGIWALGYDDTQPELWDLLADRFATTNPTWTLRSAGTSTSFYGGAFGTNLFVVVGAGGALYTSTNLASWSARSSGTTRLLLNATYAAGQFVVVGDGGTILTSGDGASWTVRSTPITNMLRGIVWGSNLFVAVGNEGVVLTSPDGATWTARNSGTNNGLQGVAYGAGLFVAVGNDGLVRTSPDGVNWTGRVSGVSNWLLDVCRGDTQFVAVGTGGRIVSSSDGITWVTQTSGTTNQLYRVAWNGTNYVAVGVGGTILRSADGANWSADISGVTNTLRAIVHGNGASLAAGFEGTLLTQGEPASSGGEEPAAGEELTITPEPSGALSNIVVYCSAGHGFCANTNSGGWYVGRTLTNGVVEDMGNLDQLNFLAAYLRNAGATVVPFRPVGYQTNEVVLDNDDAGVTFTGTWYNSSSTIFYGSAGDTPYRYAYISTNGQTAAARYTPNIPVAGFYPVYTWVLYSGNRVRQVYRIRHSGGLDEVRVNHRRVGAGWVWLGTYYFEAGTNGYVEISNEAPGYDPGSDVVIADAIRFGNGMGDVDRGWGTSGFERELEASRYWIQRMVGQGMPSDLYDRPTLNDSDDNVGAPARMADYMDNEADGSFWDRIYLGLHSNADGGSGTTRGPMGLYSTGNSAAAQARQQAFGLALARAITNDFYYLQNGVGFNDPWGNNSADIYGAVYGEISEGYNSNMNSTIIEVAYHNNAEDARLLKDPSARMYYARSILKGLIRHLSSTNAAVPLEFPPDPPTAPSAVNTTGGVWISWFPPTTNTASGGAATSYRVYRSTNGFGFGSPISATNTSVLITNLTHGATYFFRVTALNAGGESLPSEVVGVRVAPMPRAYHLVVNGFTRFDRTQSPTRYFAANIDGDVTMVRPRQINSFDYVIQHGQAIAAGGRFFDACGHMAVVSNRVALTNYHAVYWILGEESTTNETFSSAEQTLVSAYLGAGGNLFVSGAELAWDLDYRGTSSDRAFLTNWLRTAYAADSAGTNRATATAVGIFNGIGTLSFDDGSGATYRVEYPDVLSARGGAVTAMVYGSSATGANAAALQYSNVYRLVVMGFPFETITNATVRTNIMARTLTFFGDSPSESPVLRITSGNATVAYETAAAAISGTNNAAVVGWLGWTNALTGEAGLHPAASAWTITNIALAVGTNVITVQGTNAYGVSASDTVEVVRLTSSGGGGSSTNLIDEPFDEAPAAPAGWTFGGVTSYTTAAASGRNPPSVKFDSDGDWITSTYFTGGSNLSFFIKAYPATGTNSVGTFVVEQLVDGVWNSLLTLVNPVNVGTTVSVALASGATQLRFTWNKTSGNIAFDDVIVTGAAVADTDGDGLPDWWEQAYFGGPTNAVAAADSDGDGMSNGAEYTAGTDPTDADSAFYLFGVSNVAPGSAVFTFSWPSATGRVYTVRVSTNLLAAFSVFSNNIAATPPVNIFTDTVHTNADRLYYNVRVAWP